MIIEKRTSARTNSSGIDTANGIDINNHVQQSDPAANDELRIIAANNT